jgi:hypothetical protein
MSQESTLLTLFSMTSSCVRCCWCRCDRLGLLLGQRGLAILVRPSIPDYHVLDMCAETLLAAQIPSNQIYLAVEHQPGFQQECS